MTEISTSNGNGESDMAKCSKGHGAEQRKKAIFFYKLEGLLWITSAVRQTVWQRVTLYINSLPTTDCIHWHGIMLLEIFFMLEVCYGSGASSRAMITYMRCIGREGKSLLIDIMTLEILLDTYPELRPYLEDGFIVYFEACL